MGTPKPWEKPQVDTSEAGMEVTGYLPTAFNVGASLLNPCYGRGAAFGNLAEGASSLAAAWKARTRKRPGASEKALAKRGRTTA